MNPNHGGVQRVCDTLAKYFNDNGYKVYYLTYEIDEKDNYNFPAEILTLPDVNFFSTQNIQFYKNIIKKYSIDIIINHDAANERSKFFLQPTNSLAKKVSLYHTDPLHDLMSTPNLSHIIKIEYLRSFAAIYLKPVIWSIRYLKKRRQIKYLLNNSEKLVFLSEEYKRKVIKYLRVSHKKISAIPNPSLHLKHAFDFKSAIKSKIILFVSRIEMSVKRPDKMINIWSRVYESYPDWQLIFLGDGPDRQKLERMAYDLNLKNITFTGFVDPIPYYKKASIICMTSDYEGFPSVLLEGMQYGVVPVVFNNWDSLKEVIENQVSGIIVEKNDIEDFVTKICNLMNNNKQREKMAKEAMSYVSRFDIQVIGKIWTQMFEEIKKCS